MTELQKALYATDGTRNVKFRYDLLRNGVKHSELLVSDASVTFNSENSISGTARFTLKDTNNINWLNDTIKPVMLLRVAEEKETKITILDWFTIDNSNKTWFDFDNLNLTWFDINNGNITGTATVYNWVEYPLGEYIMSSHDKQITGNREISMVEAYDKTLILKEDCITERLFIAKNTDYLVAIKSIIASATFANVLADECLALLPADREFEIGTSKLDIINTLLSEIAFEKLYVDLNGIFNLKQFKNPDVSNINFTYKDDELSVICDGLSENIDYFNVPNIFIAVVSSPEVAELKSVYINTNPASPLSTSGRGRKIVSQIYKPDMISSQSQLDEYVRKKAFEVSQVAETVVINTALMPTHSFKNVIALETSKLSGIYTENQWSMELKAGGKMTHNLKRVIYI